MLAIPRSGINGNPNFNLGEMSSEPLLPKFNSGNTGNFFTTISLANAAIGEGILNLPFSFAAGGVASGKFSVSFGDFCLFE